MSSGGMLARLAVAGRPTAGLAYSLMAFGGGRGDACDSLAKQSTEWVHHGSRSDLARKGVGQTPSLGKVRLSALRLRTRQLATFCAGAAHERRSRNHTCRFRVCCSMHNARLAGPCTLFWLCSPRCLKQLQRAFRNRHGYESSALGLLRFQIVARGTPERRPCGCHMTDDSLVGPRPETGEATSVAMSCVALAACVSVGLLAGPCRHFVVLVSP